MAEETKMLAFDKYSGEQVEITDAALKPYVNFEMKLLLKSHGRHTSRWAKTKTHVLERIANRIAVPGHAGKKHKIITSWGSGKYNRNMKTVLQTLDLIEKKTKKNPLQVVATAIVNCAPRDEVTVIEQAGARYPQAVDCSPQRRIDLALRLMVQGAYGKAFGKKKKMFEALADEIVAASNNSMDSYGVTKKNEAEKQADSAR